MRERGERELGSIEILNKNKSSGMGNASYTSDTPSARISLSIQFRCGSADAAPAHPKPRDLVAHAIPVMHQSR